MARQVSKEPRGRVDVGLDRKVRWSDAEAAMIAGSDEPVSKLDRVSCGREMAISCIFSGSSSRKRSMEQS